MKKALRAAVGLLFAGAVAYGISALRQSDAAYVPCTATSAPCFYEMLDSGGTNVAGVNSSHQVAIQAPPSLPLPSNAAQETGGNLGTLAGAVSASKVNVNISSGNPTTIQPIPASTGGMSVFSKQVANNTTSVAVDASAGTLYGISAFNNSATIAYGKLFNTAQGSVTCGSGTPVDRFMIPANASGAGFIWNAPLGVAYGTAITVCVTTGYADSDTGAPAATTYIVNFYYK